MTRLSAIPVRWSISLVLALLLGALVLIVFQAGPGEQPTTDRPRPAGGNASTPLDGSKLGAGRAAPGYGEPTADALADATGSLPVAAITPQGLSFTAVRAGGEVELTGDLPEPARSVLLAEVRRSLKDARITDRTQSTGRGALSAEARAAGQFAMAQLAELNRGTVELRGGRLSLNGETRDKQALTTVTAALQQPPTGLTTRASALAAASVSPFIFSARREAGALVLGGYLPSPEIREEIAQAIRERFFHERVVDEARIADGASPRFVAGARFALDQLSQLASGEVTIAGEAVRVSGETFYPEAAGRMRETISKAAPAGWKATADIKLREAE